MTKRKSKANAKGRVACYCRVSTTGQKHDAQEHELGEYVRAHSIPDATWFRDKCSGATLDRPEFERLQQAIFAGRVSTVIVQRLDRLARSLRDGINVLTDWLERGVRIVAVRQNLDFNGATGKLVAAVLLAVAEMELETLRERTRAGVAARQAKGLPHGRPKGNRARWSLAKRKVDPALARSLRDQGVSVIDLAKRFGVSRAAVYSALRETR